eukprot:6919144-Alexandrium_andersonii.AAC.1
MPTGGPVCWRQTPMAGSSLQPVARYWEAGLRAEVGKTCQSSMSQMTSQGGWLPAQVSLKVKNEAPFSPSCLVRGHPNCATSCTDPRAKVTRKVCLFCNTVPAAT